MNEERNPYGYATKEWYAFEAKRHGFATSQEWLQHEKAIRPKCPDCGVPFGFNFGTGDCNCADD